MEFFFSLEGRRERKVCRKMREVKEEGGKKIVEEERTEET